LRSAFASILPPEVMAALESGNQEQARAALGQMAPDQRQALLEQMTDLAGEAGMEVPGPEGLDMEQVLDEFEPLLQGIAAAVADESLRAEVEPVLADLEEKGWMLRQPAQRIWAGERDPEALTAGLDDQDSALVRRVLELLEP
jgi:hypothetical protein